MTKIDLTAYILVGGGSRRMGVDKLFLQVGDQSLIERAIATCARCFERVKLAAGQPAKFSSFGYPVVLDSPQARGPMAGVIAALEDCDSDTCFVTAADLIDLNAEVITLLVSHYRGQQYLGLAESGGLQPLCGIYHKSALAALSSCAQSGDFRLVDALDSLNHSSIALPAGRWRNINSPEDLAAGGANG